MSSKGHDRRSFLTGSAAALAAGSAITADQLATMASAWAQTAPWKPEARAKLAEGNRRTREAVERLIEEEYGRLGIPPTMPTEALAKISLALFEGLNVLQAPPRQQGRGQARRHLGG